MTIRINRIKINRAGPLEKDFQLEPGDINLIYGQNETGKSYVVESLISLLFRTGKKSPIEWNLRNWDSAGNVVVSGLSDKPVIFSNTSKKLDDYWEGGNGLPQNFSRLLVVKEGETLLARDEDGVGRDILKNYLSGEGLLDRIGTRISTTLQKTNITNGQIIGPNMGEIKKRDQLLTDMKELDKLLREAEDGYASGEVSKMRQKQRTIKDELDTLGKARRYYAARLHKQRKSLYQELEALPKEEEISRIASDISVFESKQTETSNKVDTLSGIEDAAGNYCWTEKALGIYKELMSGPTGAGPMQIYMVFAVIFLVGAIVTGLLHFSIPLAICVAGSLASFILYYVGTRRALATAGNNRELEKLKLEFKNRYGSELTDRAALEARLEKFQKDNFRFSSLTRELEEELRPYLKSQESNIRVTLKTLTGYEHSPEQWRPAITELRSKIKRLGDEIGLLDVAMASLAVQEKDYLDQDPGTDWHNDRYANLEIEANETENTLQQELQKLEQLRTRIIQETHSVSTEWEDLITALRDKREHIIIDYRLVTAEVLAKLQVNAVIQEFRREEDSRIAVGLGSEELTRPLHTVTGRYKSIRHEVGRGIILTSDADEEYPLAAVSTGTKEQVFLAMRIGFSSIIMRKQTAFLILDDAFQHSDWRRRITLMGQILSLAENGWQVFYFTMDDHIKNLFLKLGADVGDRFRSVEL